MAKHGPAQRGRSTIFLMIGMSVVVLTLIVSMHWLLPRGSASAQQQPASLSAQQPEPLQTQPELPTQPASQPAPLAQPPAASSIPLKLESASLAEVQLNPLLAQPASPAPFTAFPIPLEDLARLRAAYDSSERSLPKDKFNGRIRSPSYPFITGDGFRHHCVCLRA